MTAPVRPAMRYHGGKWRLMPWIVGHFPPHRTYVEPFGGAMSVLLRKPRSYAEIYNDLDQDVVGLFRVLRDPAQATVLRQALELTPYARLEFEQSYAPTDDPIERARRLLVRSWMAHGSSGLQLLSTGFRIGSMREYTTPAMDWVGWPAAMPAIVARLQGVILECRPATQIIARHDSPSTLFYLDPPYLFATRSQKRNGYRHELSDAGHRGLLRQLSALSGMVAVSGYPSALYDRALRGWRRYETDARADRGQKRIEVLWLNPAAATAADHAQRGGIQLDLIEAAADVEAGLQRAIARRAALAADAAPPG